MLNMHNSRDASRSTDSLITPATTFIFDVGGVLLRHDNELLYERLAARCTDPIAARRQLADALHDDDFGTGRLGIDVLHARLAANFGFRGSYADFAALWSSHFSRLPEMEPVFRAIAGRYRTVLFSNTNAVHWRHVMAHYPVLSDAHTIYVSHELGLVKPDPASFQRVLELEGCAAERSVFIDDRADNTAAAAALGMHAITFTGAAALVRELAAAGFAVDV
jgi:glucose-1-phosphatase